MFPGKAERIHWSIDDPADTKRPQEEQLTVFRRVRDELREHLRRFAAAMPGALKAGPKAGA